MNPIAWLLALAACDGGEVGDDKADTDTPADADTDTDTDTDTDADADADADTDADTDTASTTPTGATGATADTGTAPVTPPSSPPAVVSNCPAYAFSGWTDPYFTSPELNVLGVYTGGGAGGAVNVEVLRATQMTLVLSAYDPVTWNLTVGPGVTLDAVILNGYDAQTVTGVPYGVPVLDRSPYVNWYGDCGYAWPGSPGGCDTQALVTAIQADVGLPLTSFHGCYDPGSLRLQ